MNGIPMTAYLYSMRIFTGVLSAVLLAMGVATWSAPAVGAQAPLTADSLRAIVSGARNVARSIAWMAAADSDLQVRARSLRDDFAHHNEEQCEYLQGKPELCANYDDERLDLLERSAALQQEMRTSAGPLRAARAQFAAAMDHLRTASYAAGVADQKAQLMVCADLNYVARVTACLARTPAVRRSR
ncbi:MAG TPA: hypothetical protein VGM77_03285 [Gemmatimonadales bacterium]|jgi:hypothetical protein